MPRASGRILVCLDSNHTHEHVLAELDGYAPLTSVGSYCIVFDTIIEDLPAGTFPDRAWDRGNNPKTAVHAWIKSHPEFEIDKAIQNKLYDHRRAGWISEAGASVAVSTDPSRASRLWTLKDNRCAR